MPRINLPDTDEYGTGQWVDIRDPRRVTRGDRKKFMSFGRAASNAVAAAGGDMSKVDPDLTISAGTDALDGLLVMWVTEWSLTRRDETGTVVPWPVPAQAPELLDELDLDVSNVIEKALEPVMGKLMGRSVTAADTAADSPSVPSAA